MSSNSSNDQVLSLSTRSVNWLPLTADRPPNRFLSLAPVMSPSYPQPRKASVPSIPVPAESADGVVVDIKQRRSSSLSSDSSSKSASGLRILKLSPVHCGEHLGDHQLDWHEVVIE